MAKLTGPLFSLDARGKLGKSLVFIGWKGIKTVRQWLVPANPKSTGQGNIRTVIGNLGKTIGKIIVDSAFHDQLVNLELIPDQQTKQSYLVQYIKDNYITGAGATMTAAYNAQLALYTGSAGLTSWSAAAGNLVLTAFNSTYDNIATWQKGLGLFLLAKAAVALEFTGTPYTYAKAPASWTVSRIHAMITDMTGAG